MPQYLVANYLPDDFDPSTVTEAMMEEIHALNREMIAAGVRKFACGISPVPNAKTLRRQLRRHGARHRRTVHRDQGAHGRILDTGMRRYGRGAGLGEARVPSPAMWPARCASFYSSRLRNKDPAEASKQPGRRGLGTRPW